MQVCPRCQRANPEVAVFCYFDGVVLRPDLKPSLAGVPPGHLARPFTFPSGKNCQTYDELVEACQEDWKGARTLLRRGGLAKFLASIGRTDLARAAKEAGALPDLDQAVTTFLAALPTNRPRAPKLEVNPRRLVLGSLRLGESREVRLTVTNQGVGMLQGVLTLSDARGGPCSWIRVARGKKPGKCTIKTPGSQEVELHVDTTGLAAGEAYQGRVVVTTNGGGAEVPVRLEVASLPFPWPPFQGARNPRDMAERMRKKPRAAVEFLESGEVARWFLSNGWHYPVQGPLAPGVAAVQQFFEGMGLSRVPVVQVSEPEVRMAPVVPEVVRWEVTLFTDVKKWVYGEVESDVPWLKILTPTVSGPQQAVISFEVDSSLLEPNRFYAAQVHIRANGGQQLTIPVRVDVQGRDDSLARRLFGTFLTSALLLGTCLPAAGGFFGRGNLNGDTSSNAYYAGPEVVRFFRPDGAAGSGWKA